MKSRRWITWGIALAGLPLLTGLWAGGVRLSGNIHEVEPGALYRSAQINGDQLRATLRSHQIRTVINLRGATAGQGWYDDEIAASSELGVRHVDIPLSAKREPDEATTERLLNALRDEPGPILIHCNGGPTVPG